MSARLGFAGPYLLAFSPAAVSSPRRSSDGARHPGRAALLSLERAAAPSPADPLQRPAGISWCSPPTPQPRHPEAGSKRRTSLGVCAPTSGSTGSAGAEPFRVGRAGVGRFPSFWATGRLGALRTCGSDPPPSCHLAWPGLVAAEDSSRLHSR